MKVLLVEDHPALADMSCRVLRDMHDHEVEHAATGASALDTMAKFQPEVVLVDIHLPDMNGYELARRLRANPAHEKTILVALTGFGSVVDDFAAKSVGFDAHFRKPMDFELLPTLKRASDSTPG